MLIIGSQIAEMMNKFDTIGQDLVAMCVNDILCAGAEPFAFLDYMACGRLQLDVATTIVKSVADACIMSGCALLGTYNLGEYIWALILFNGGSGQGESLWTTKRR